MSPSNSETAPAGRPGRNFFPWICIVLALGTVALYWPITHHPFIVFDDVAYISGNPHVTSGLSETNFIWAFTTSEQANWHPLTWLSHQLDCTLFGLNPGDHHLVNLLYHTANTLLLFLFLYNATGATWRSAFVAALFAWHPMHVESVAWAAERKDVLSTFFWLLTVLAWMFYARSVPNGPSQYTGHGSAAQPRTKGRAVLFYVVALVCCACGLMSKPMVVTLPFALLLLDFWPLARLADFKSEASVSRAPAGRPVSITRAVLEKIPFLALAIAGSVVTYLVQSGGGAVSKIHINERLTNAALAYERYTAKLFCPTDLSIIYPHPRHWPVALALLALALLVVWTVLCAGSWRRVPYLTMGWLWFLGTLVPTIGFIQVGAQSMADRYTYIPSIGLFVAVTWGVTEFLSKWEIGKVILPLAGGAALAGCLAAASYQIHLWRDSIALFRHAVAVTADNYAAENVLGKAYEKAGNDAAAMACYSLAVKTEPRFPQSQFNLAMCLLALPGRTAEAFEHLQAAGALEPRDADIQYDLGIYFSQHGGWTNAVNCFSNSILVRPDFAPAQLAMGSALANIGSASAAAAHFRAALRLDSNLLQAKTNLDRLLAEHPGLH